MGRAVGDDLVPGARHRPTEWAGRRVEALLDLGFDQNMPGFQCEGLVYRARRHPGEAVNPRNQWVPVASRPPAGKASSSTSRPPPTRSSSTTTRSCRPRRATRPPRRPRPQYTTRRMDLAVFDGTRLRARARPGGAGRAAGRAAEGSPRRLRILRAIDDALDASTCRTSTGTAAAARAALATVLAQPGRGHRAPDQRGRPRPHRLRLAVAAARDGPQGRPDRRPT